MADYRLLRGSAVLLFSGLLFTFLVGMLHDDRAEANDHVASFTNYANSEAWTAVHLGQFVGVLVIVAGLLILFYALNFSSGWTGWASRFAAVSAIVALALYGVLQGVDGVALKQATVAWLSAPEAEKAARFASAEAVRWLEWGIRSYYSFMLGLSFILYGVVIVATGRVPRPVGFLMGLSGLAYIAQGWVIVAEGFSDNNTIPTLTGYLVWLAWSIWLLVVAFRRKGSAAATAVATAG
jgi:hypothetical protein